MQELQPSRGEQIGEEVTPVTLPPGRFRLATSPSLTGSVPSVNTIGIVAVAALAASAATGVTVPITATCRRTSSAANAGSRSYWPWALRYSIATLLPSTKPDWLRPKRSGEGGVIRPLKQSDHRQRPLLRSRRERPCRRAAEKRDEVAALEGHSM